MQLLSATLQAADWSAGGPETDPFLAKAMKHLSEQWPVSEKRVLEAVQALEDGRRDEAGRTISKFLAKHPKHPDALNLAAEIAQRSGDLKGAEVCLARCVHWAPERVNYRYNYAVILIRLVKLDGALMEAEKLLEADPGNSLFRHLHTSLLLRMHKFDEAIPGLRRLAEDHPDVALFWVMLGQALRSLGGHPEECIAAFRHAVVLSPALGSAWWALASLKTFRFSEEDIRAMEAQLARPPASAGERADLHYALGKAYDDVMNYEKSFQQYSRGNAIRRVGLDYDPDATTSMVTRAKAVFTPEFFRERNGLGCRSREPIFVLGLQRAGSTLVEQILDSHSQIEGAGELPTVLKIVGDDVMPKSGPDYPSGMDRLTADDLKSFGEKYLTLTRGFRRRDKPFFVDKCPYNLWHIGLIRLMLPEAKIIDVRRHPIGCCYANFTMSFVHAPPLSYNLTHIGRFYADYVRLMAHFDRVLPGVVHRVIYEDLVANLESEVRRMLDFLELPFEPACLEYYRTERAFSSFSNEQVRQPIFREGVERWRNYEPWLGQLKAALGPVLDAYPGVPEFDDA